MPPDPASAASALIGAEPSRRLKVVPVTIQIKVFPQPGPMTANSL